MINLADELAEQQLRDGTASAQVITFYLKLGSSREKLEQARIEADVRMAEAKIEQIASQKRIEDLYAQALGAMRSYQGMPPEEQDEYRDDDY